jgi:uncharacterized protein YerC
MKKRTVADKNLLHMDGMAVLVYSRGVSGKTNAEVGRDMGIGEETVARYQRDPNPGEHPYDIGLRRIAGWCQAVGNDIVPQWIAQQCGGMFVRTDQEGKDANITTQMERVNKEAGEAVGSLLSALSDGTISRDERIDMIKELEDLCRTANEALGVAKRMKEQAGS